MAAIHGLSRFCSLARREVLFVDEDAGAGLELLPVQDGLLISEVLEFPGQAHLHAGDIIVAIDGADLAARACGGQAVQQKEIFRVRAQHGTNIIVLEGFADPKGLVRFRCPMCRRGFASWPPCLRHHVAAWREQQVEEGKLDRGQASVHQPTSALVRAWMEKAADAAKAEPIRDGSHAPGCFVAPSSPPLPTFGKGLMQSNASTSLGGTGNFRARSDSKESETDSSDSEVLLSEIPLLGSSQVARAVAPNPPITSQQQGTIKKDEEERVSLAQMDCQAARTKARVLAARARMQTLGLAKRERVATCDKDRESGNNLKTSECLESVKSVWSVSPPAMPPSTCLGSSTGRIAGTNRLSCDSGVAPGDTRTEHCNATGTGLVREMGDNTILTSKTIYSHCKGSEGSHTQDYVMSSSRSNIDRRDEEMILANEQLESNVEGNREAHKEPDPQVENSEENDIEEHPLRIVELPQRTWWVQFFELYCMETPGAGILRVTIVNICLQDADMPSLTASLDQLLIYLRHDSITRIVDDCTGCHNAPLRLLLDLDLSKNEVSDSGAVWLFEWLLQRQREVRCRKLSLACNRIGDPSLEWLAAVIRSQPSAIEELHLSNNQAITCAGAASVFVAVALHPDDAYPLLDEQGLFRPAFVDFGQCSIHEPGSLLARLRLRAGLMFTHGSGPDSNGPSKNAFSSLSFAQTPHVCIRDNLLSAKSSEWQSHRVPAALPAELEKVCTGRPWPRLPDLPSPLLTEPALQQTGVSSRYSASQSHRTSILRAELMIDEEEGAGLQLETTTEGLEVCEIMEIPGQPGLETHDIIRSIDGLPLWWEACKDDRELPDETASKKTTTDGEDKDDFDPQFARFGARFRLGARLDVIRRRGASLTQAVKARSLSRFRCPDCSQGFDRWGECLQHIKDTGHEPRQKAVQGSQVKNPCEDASACIRRWMSVCMAAARGELPDHSPAQLKTDSTETTARKDEASQALLLPAVIGFRGVRCGAVLDSLADDASRCGNIHDCLVWALPDGLQAECRYSLDASHHLASLAAPLLESLHFHLPDVAESQNVRRSNEDIQASLLCGRFDSPNLDATMGTVDWSCWLDSMLQQQDEHARGPAKKNYSITSSAPALSNAKRISHQMRPSMRAEAHPFVPFEIAQLAASLRMLVLCGLPGSGKSTLAKKLNSLGWKVVNQDTLGSRQACLRAARAVLKQPRQRLVVDRCNSDAAQRAVWVQSAVRDFGLSAKDIGCIWLDVPAEECGRRVLNRFGHRTLPPQEASLKVIRGFAKSWQDPGVDEGFAHVWHIISDLDFETFWAELSASEDKPGSTSDLQDERAAPSANTDCNATHVLRPELETDHAVSKMLPLAAEEPLAFLELLPAKP
eukprot:TRINITY_DN2519_c1_g1_i1.p1 TRINITY_DN2519_c1_g1~~TRINITY_DN2519_c1_g1_i1.p1  ORF type:complete len:1371 (-),score=221.24 TRINITY_DN2519_c1_g1_i1:278-4390(-)